MCVLTGQSDQRPATRQRTWSRELASPPDLNPDPRAGSTPARTRPETGEVSHPAATLPTLSRQGAGVMSVRSWACEGPPFPATLPADPPLWGFRVKPVK